MENRKNNGSKNREDDLLIQRALPLESNLPIGDQFILEEGDQEAVNYLLGVRSQSSSIPQVYKSAKYNEYKKEMGDRDYLGQSLSRIIFQPTLQEEDSQQSEGSLYQDADVVFSKTQQRIQYNAPLTNQLTQKREQKQATRHWDPQWIKDVLTQRLLMQKKVRTIQQSQDNSNKIKNASAYFNFMEQKLKNNKEPSEADIARASEVVLQDIFGMIADEKEDQWDELDFIPEQDLLWIYGLLCITEKPLLPDQAADINSLLNVLLKSREALVHNEALAQQKASIEINIAIITEYFEQRFK